MCMYTCAHTSMHKYTSAHAWHARPFQRVTGFRVQPGPRALATECQGSGLTSRTPGWALEKPLRVSRPRLQCFPNLVMG
jgi:hypothetical protein